MISLCARHPDGGLHVGDRISLEVIALQPADLVGVDVDVGVVEEQGEMGLQALFGQYGIGRPSAGYPDLGLEYRWIDSWRL